MYKHYLVLAVRNARRAPLAAAVNVLTLAIGLACFLTAYAFVAFLERADRHFPDAERTYVLRQSFSSTDGSFARSNLTRTPEQAAEALEAYFPNVETARALALPGSTSVSSGLAAAGLSAVAVDPGFLDVFPLPFAAGDSRAALRAPRSAVLTRDVALRLFGSGGAVGRPLDIGNGTQVTVTGVLDALPEPSHFGRSESAPLRFDMLVSTDVRDAVRAALNPEFAERSARSWVGGDALTYLVLAEGMRVQDVERRLPDFVLRRVPEDQRDRMEITFDLLPVGELLRASLDEELLSGDLGLPVSSVLLALGALVLGIACVNYANLATARAARRVREVGVRKALGAPPLQIALQHLCEAGLSTGLALLAAFAVFRTALPILETASGMRLGNVAVDFELWVFLGAVGVLAALAAGAYPAVVLSRVAAVSAVRASFAQPGAKRLAAWLVGAQFAAASLLLIAVTVTSLQNAKLVRTGLGVTADPLVLIENQTAVTKVDAATLHAELARLPGVTGITETAWLPWQRLVVITFVGASPDPAAERSRVLTRPVGSDFFRVLGIEVVAGRVFDDALDGSAAAQRIVVDRAFVEQFGLGSPAEAIDRVVYTPRFGAPEGSPQQIIGVVENRRLSFRGGGAEAVIYSFGRGLGVTYVRIAASDVAGALAGIDSVWRRLAPNVAISRRFFDEAFGQAYETFARLGLVFNALSLMALAISTAGLVGMTTLIVGRRRREIGVRKTFGATATQMTLMLLAAFSRPVVVANVLVWPLAYWAARTYLRAFIDPVALGPGPFLLALVLTLAVAWLAVGVQTARAARLKPADVLRNE